MTKADFIATYRDLVVAEYAWARDKVKLERFMATVADTLGDHTGPDTWFHTGPVVKRAWRAIGGRGTPSLKHLRSLA